MYASSQDFPEKKQIKSERMWNRRLQRQNNFAGYSSLKMLKGRLPLLNQGVSSTLTHGRSYCAVQQLHVCVLTKLSRKKTNQERAHMEQETSTTNTTSQLLLSPGRLPLLNQGSQFAANAGSFMLRNSCMHRYKTS